MIHLQSPRSLQVVGSTRDLLAQVTERSEELNALRPFDADVAARLRTSLLPDRIVASLNMEGIVATRRQTLEVMDAMRIQESIGKGEKEIFNILKADEFIHDAVDRGLSVDERFLREINRLLMNDLKRDAGEFRATEVELPGAPFRPPSPPAVPGLIAQLCEFFSQSEALHPILQAAWLHAQFTLIHPFSDGNGRTGRLLQDFVLVRRGLLPVGIPPAHRDDYYAALEHADQEKWDDLVEMIALLELSIIAKTEVIASEPKRRTAWIQRLSTAAANKAENTRHKVYLVWRQRMEQISKAFAQASVELDGSSDVIGAQCREFGVVEFSDWKRICERGYTERGWLFSIIFFAEGQPFYKLIGFLRRHSQNAADPFSPERDLVGLYFTGTDAQSFERPEYRNYSDPHIRIRELLYQKDDLFEYRQNDPESSWDCTSAESIASVIEAVFYDVFARKAGIGE